MGFFDRAVSQNISSLTQRRPLCRIMLKIRQRFFLQNSENLCHHATELP
ncbi:tRNA-specific adenosine deaminase [Acetobacter orientalis]|uniref:tRNA-specific adenosine deaminase n=1 Tax=Acetobacter orientalis TaxID=146474 RepID=A0A2Z5ZI20_9PROT|nr:tRNA-specific adenosine deaminase [Acetobacter orientalis]